MHVDAALCVHDPIEEAYIVSKQKHVYGIIGMQHLAIHLKECFKHVCQPKNQPQTTGSKESGVRTIGLAQMRRIVL